MSEAPRIEAIFLVGSETPSLPESVLENQTVILKSVFDCSKDGVAIADQTGKLIYFNPAAHQILGIGETSVYPNEWSRVYNLYRADKVTLYPWEELPLVQALRGKVVMDAELYVQNPATNSGKFITVTAKPMWREGRLAGAIAVFDDSTERKDQELLLKVSEEKFRLAFEEGAFGFALVDQEMRFARVNHALCDLVEYSASELMGKHVLDITHPDDRDRCLALRSDLLERRIDKSTLEKRYLTKSGEVRWVNITVNPVFAGSAFQFFFTLIEDITEKRLVQQREASATRELARSNSELQQFAYAASHDLKEPLRMVAMFSELIRQKYAKVLDAEGLEYIDYATDGVKRMHALIDALLEFSRVSRTTEKKVPVDLNRVVELAKSNVGLMLAETNSTVRCSPLPTVHGLESSLIQLFQNLISNAIKFRTEKAPFIEINVQQAVDEFVFSVKDNGIGIEPQFHDRIFILFQRLHSREEYPGSGIGLSICKKIVEAHGGRIWVESESNAGACFRFALPRPCGTDCV